MKEKHYIFTLSGKKLAKVKFTENEAEEIAKWGRRPLYWGEKLIGGEYIGVVIPSIT